MKIQKERNKIARLLMKERETPFAAVDLNKIPHPPWMTRCFRNNRYIVMIMDNCPTTHGPAIRAMVQNHANTPITNHWAEMQRIKNQIFGEEVTAIEYYPKQSELTDQANIYWMWIFPENVLPIPIK